MKNCLYVLSMILFSSCFLRTPLLSATDKYALVKNPGANWSIVEIEAIRLDSIFGYPIMERAIRSFVLVKRGTNSSLARSSKIKVFFNKKNNNLHWQIRNDMYSAKVIYQDTFSLKKATWYRLSSANTNYDLYIFCKNNGGDYFVKEKPKPGAW